MARRPLGSVFGCRTHRRPGVRRMLAGCDVGYALVVGRAVPLSQMLDLESIERAPVLSLLRRNSITRCAPDARPHGSLITARCPTLCRKKTCPDDSSPMLDPPT